MSSNSCSTIEAGRPTIAEDARDYVAGHTFAASYAALLPFGIVAPSTVSVAESGWMAVPGRRPRDVAAERAGLLTGAVDGTWAAVLTLAYGRSLVRLWQGIAATSFGDSMFEGGAATVARGAALHEHPVCRVKDALLCVGA